MAANWKAMKPDAMDDKVILAAFKNGVPTEVEEHNDFADFIAKINTGRMADLIKADPEAVLFVLVRVWPAIQVISFYNSRDPVLAQERADAAKTRKDLNVATQDALAARSDLGKVMESAKLLNSQLTEAKGLIGHQDAIIADLELDIIKLKARILDLMDAK